MNDTESIKEEILALLEKIDLERLELVLRFARRLAE